MEAGIRVIVFVFTRNIGSLLLKKIQQKVKNMSV